MSEAGSVARELDALFPKAVEAAEQDGDFEIIRIAKKAFLPAVKFLKESRGFVMLMDLTAVDWMGAKTAPVKERFELVYYLMPAPPESADGLLDRKRLRLKVAIDAKDAAMDSLAFVFGSANWLEREVWDMYGIRFSGHPDLRRILMYEEFSGHPLRKDYPLRKEQPRVRQDFGRVPPFGRNPLPSEGKG